MHFCTGEYKRAAGLGNRRGSPPRPQPLEGTFAGFVKWLVQPPPEPLAEQRGSCVSPPPRHTPLQGGCPRPARVPDLLPVLTASPGAGLRSGCRGSGGPPRRSRAPCGAWCSGAPGHGALRGQEQPFVPGERSPSFPAAPLPGSAPRCLWPPPPPRPRPRAAPSWPRCPLGSGPGSLSAAPRLLLTACTGEGAGPRTSASRPRPQPAPARSQVRCPPGARPRPAPRLQPPLLTFPIPSAALTAEPGRPPSPRAAVASAPLLASPGSRGGPSARALRRPPRAPEGAGLPHADARAAKASDS